MKRMQKYLLLVYLIFLIGLRLAGSAAPPISSLLLVLSYLLPLLCFFLLAREEIKKSDLSVFSIKKHRLGIVLPLFFPTVLLLCLLSALTSLLLGIFGLSSETVLSGSFFTILVDTVLFPAILEELLFRFLPLCTLAPYGKRGAIFFSALCFSLVHCNLFQIPYAFAAGLLFAAIDLATGSILPSVLFHIGNNALSVLLILYGSAPRFSLIFFLSLSVLSLLSLLLIVRKRKEYKDAFSRIFSEKEKYFFTKYMILFAALTFFYAACRLA